MGLRKFKRGMLVIFTSFLSFVLILVTLFFINPLISVFTYHVFASDSLEIELDGEEIDYKVTFDQTYDSVYANGSFDYYEQKNSTNKSPLIIWVYSFSYFKGDKSDLVNYIPFYVNEGYNVAVLNFEKGANTKFPTAIKQVMEAYQYLISNFEVLNVDTDNIFLIGSNTGAIIASQFITAIYNESYQEALLLNDFNASIKGTLLFYGSENIKPFNQVNEISDLLYQRINWAYYNNRHWLLSDHYIFNYELTNLPKIYITETNSYEYIKEGSKLKDNLPESNYYNPDLNESTNLPYNYYIYLDDQAELGDKARINFNKTIEFMKEIIKS